jgi:hypothetical protein
MVTEQAVTSSEYSAVLRSAPSMPECTGLLGSNNTPR